ncbi:histidine ammonia-lyase [Thermogemmatispora sp.]|uniref:histidine ammonia-lyase n=1 Tax=Thermogemmatispora sp. TaxID=1968838 RepID=UPI001DC508D6|nr:histidine ammonia-lyase [Thermogemmatispora sp.]MBX5449955.1 histidine ammonia-lyase [Thermogemmatispora sp.]
MKNQPTQHHQADSQSAPLVLNGQALTPAEVIAVARHQAPVRLGPEAEMRIQRARTLIERIVAEDRKVYGVTTGFGHLSRVRIRHEQVLDLQYNLLRSHAAGLGEPLDEATTRAMMLLLAASLARGHSGVRVEVVRLLIDLLNAQLHPIVPSRGSVGASGDLAPLAHLALVLVGEGEAWYRGRRLPGAQALAEAGLQPLRLEAKEGLALINGTHLMEASAILSLEDAWTLLHTAEVACALSIEALMGSHVPFDERIQRVRNQHGQQQSAEHLRRLLANSEIKRSHEDCPRVQDPYTLRCAPQVFGAIRDALDYCEGIFVRELGAVTDNPLIFPEEGEVLTGGNFHGQPLALALDVLALALTQLASFAERRIYLLMGPHDWDDQGAPLFLTPEPGLNSGLMLTQYVAAALVNEMKVLAHPASIDSIPTSAGTEDFVSMGVTAAHKARRVLALAQQVVAIELLCGAQLLEFRRPLRAGEGVERAFALVRTYVPKLERDRPPAPDIERLTRAVQEGVFRQL